MEDKESTFSPLILESQENILKVTPGQRQIF